MRRVLMSGRAPHFLIVGGMIFPELKLIPKSNQGFKKWYLIIHSNYNMNNCQVSINS